MSRRFSPRWALVGLAIPVVIATTARVLVGRQPPRPRPDSATLVPGKVEIRDRIPVKNDPPFQLPPPELSRAMDFTHFDVQVDGRTATVSAGARVYETEKIVYVWSLRIFDLADPNDRRLHHEHHYADQAVWLEDNQTTMKPSFGERVQLPPGEYRVQLLLHAAAPDFDFRKVQFGEDIRDRVHLQISRSRRITIE